MRLDFVPTPGDEPGLGELGNALTQLPLRMTLLLLGRGADVYYEEGRAKSIPDQIRPGVDALRQTCVGGGALLPARRRVEAGVVV